MGADSTGRRAPRDWHALPRDLKPADYMRLARQVTAGDGEPLEPVRVACLSSYSLGFVEPFLVVEGTRFGLRVVPYFGEFGQFEQVLADPESRLYAFAPDVLVLALRPEDLDPDAVTRFHASGGTRLRALAREAVERLARCTAMFRERATGPVLVANFAAPADPPMSLFDANLTESVAGTIVTANAELASAIHAHAGAVVWDYAGLVAATGSTRWTDRRLWALGRIPVSAECQPLMARHLARTIRASRRPPAKCLVFDLDNTIWGGVVGDDGVEGIRLGDDYPGNAYKALQRSALALNDRGILLAVASKNDEEVVRNVFREHPEMLLSWEHLAAARINWQPKSQNLRAIADELNIGSDALVFFDDNPVERAEVRRNAPEVGVIEVPTDPLDYVAALADAFQFDQLALSEEDRGRSDMYQRERQRRALATGAESVEDFLASLDMVAQVGQAGQATLGRIAQLVGKTNQFNLTTRRHSQADLQAMADDPNGVVAWLRLRDRFGDQGLVAVGVLRVAERQAVIDTLVMSCRVMNRHVERALVAYLNEHAARLGCDGIVGEYIPTKKNAMVRDLYPALGFAPMEGDGVERFVKLVGDDACAWPAMIAREDAARDAS
ncbi:MAG TPA: HAD-IIIC family phosphatase [Gemmatimonadales bacterium]